MNGLAADVLENHKLDRVGKEKKFYILQIHGRGTWHAKKVIETKIERPFAQVSVELVISAHKLETNHLIFDTLMLDYIIAIIIPWEILERRKWSTSVDKTVRFIALNNSQWL